MIHSLKSFVGQIEFIHSDLIARWAILQQMTIASRQVCIICVLQGECEVSILQLIVCVTILF